MAEFELLVDLPLEIKRDIRRIQGIDSNQRTTAQAAVLTNYDEYITNGVQVRDDDNNIVLASGKTVPTSSYTGFATGAIFRDIDSNLVYINLGDENAANFDRLTTGDANPSFSGDVTLGDASDDSLIVKGDSTFENTAIFTKDNATSLRIKGASEATSASAGADIQSYTGMFTNANYNNAASGGTKKNRLTFGANYDMDLVLQCPHQIRIVAADNSVTGGDADAATTNGVGNILMISRSDVIISPWAAAEALGDNYIVITSITETVADTGGGGYQAADMVIKANAGSLYLNYGITDGAVVLPSLTSAERDALTPVKGMIIYDETNDEVDIYDGAWKQVTVSAAT